jgi:hypothetical protein
VTYLAMLHQALRDLSRGVQPVVSLTVDGGARADVGVGREVTLRATVAAPPGTGFVVGLEWDFDGAGLFPRCDSVEAAETIDLERRWTAPGPGTYFPVVGVVTQRDGDRDRPYARLRNLARVRVVVSRR